MPPGQQIGAAGAGGRGWDSSGQSKRGRYVHVFDRRNSGVICYGCLPAETRLNEYTYFITFRRNPKSHLNAWPSSIFFYVDLDAYIFYVGQKINGRAGALLIFFIHVYPPPKGG